jgi:hypothetical protein
MSLRITSRRRPRLNRYPWPYATLQTTESALLFGAPFDYEYLIGPLPAPAVMELIYRVTQISWALEVTSDIDGTPETLSGSGTIGLETSFGNATLPTEAETFGFNRSAPFGDDLEALADFYRAYPFTNSTGEAGGLNLLAYITPFANRTHPIYEDENGLFWLHGDFNMITAEGGDPATFFGGGNFISGGGPGDIRAINASLILATGTYSIRAFVYGGDDVPTSGTFTLTATAWHAYATLAGLPAWDTATGLPLNGGPGA